MHLPKSSLLSVDRFTAALLAWKFICGHNQLACEFDIRPHRRPPHTRGSTVQKPAHLMHRYYFALLRIRFRQNTRPPPAHTTGHGMSKLVSGSPATPVLDLMTGNCRRPGTHLPLACTVRLRAARCRALYHVISRHTAVADLGFRCRRHA